MKTHLSARDVFMAGFNPRPKRLILFMSGIVLLTVVHFNACELFDRKKDHPPRLPISFTPVVLDSSVSPYANFSSYNQRLVANSKGIFYVYIDTTNANLSASLFRLVKINSAGQICDTLFSKTAPCSAPVLETDDQSNIWLMYSDIHNRWGEYRAYLLRFRAAANYANPDSFSYPMAASYGKFAMFIDNHAQCLYWMAQMDGVPLLKIDFNGNEIWRQQPIEFVGLSANVQYPLLAIDDAHRLHVPGHQKRTAYITIGTSITC